VDARNGAVGIRLAPKLTLAHIYLTISSKMSVKLAAQVLSQSVSAGMRVILNFHFLWYNHSNRCLEWKTEIDWKIGWGCSGLREGARNFENAYNAFLLTLSQQLRRF